MGKTVEEEVKEVLNQTTEKVEFEESLDAKDSPLNQPVAEGEIGHNSSSTKQSTEKQQQKDDVVVEPQAETNEEATTQHSSEEETIEANDNSSSTDNTAEDFYFDSNQDDDVPEQEIGSGEYDEQLEDEMPEGEDFEIPNSHAKQATDTVFGIANNLMSIGGGFFVKIKKHKEFYDFEEVIQIIEEQNEKNVKKLKLDDEDKILLRPLLITILRKKAKKLTPEEQLIGAVLSILMKKGQMVMEIKAENEILVDRILDVIREEKGYSDQDVQEEEETENDTPQLKENESKEQEPKEETDSTAESTTEENETVEEVEVIDDDENFIQNTVLEIADDNEEIKPEKD